MEKMYQAACDKCRRYAQEHLLQYYDTLSFEEKESLLRQIAETDFEVVNECANAGKHEKKGKIEPIEVMRVQEIDRQKQTLAAAGKKHIREGKIAAVLLAGGMGTRLGSDAPKGMYDIGVTKPMYIFERIIGNLMDVVKETGTWIHLFVMTSDKNHEATVAFLREKNFFGYNADYVTFFKQSMAPATDYSGKILMESRYTLASSPNGNGGWFRSLVDAGLLSIIKERGIEWLNVFAVDNVLQRIADPAFVGATIDGGYVCGAKVIKKCDPDEKVGAMCLEDGRPSIIEYIDFTDEYKAIKDAHGECAINFGVILNYLFSVTALEGILQKKIPIHVVNKKIPHMVDSGEFVKPDVPNGYKFETLVVDMIHLLDNCLPYEVVREKEFAPIKNPTGVDSVESARKLLQLNGVEL